jgi:hypothetical protein
MSKDESTMRVLHEMTKNPSHFAPAAIKATADNVLAMFAARGEYAERLYDAARRNLDLRYKLARVGNDEPTYAAVLHDVAMSDADLEAALAKNVAPVPVEADAAPSGATVDGQTGAAPELHSVFRAEAREVWTTITGNGPGLWKDYDLQSVETLEKALQRAATLSQSVESGWTRYGEKMPTGADTEAGIDIRYVSTEPKGFLSAVAWRRTPCALNVQSVPTKRAEPGCPRTGEPCPCVVGSVCPVATFD